jgi:phospholipase C
VETNITPWRRAVVGDLTSAFDFGRPRARPVTLPDTSAYRPADALRHPDALVAPPSVQALPVQERGVRRARALPYELDVRGRLRLEQGGFQLRFINSGEAAAVFHARSSDPGEAPRSYTVEAGRELDGAWPVRVGDAPYALSVFGPNGFTRTFRGGAIGPRGTDLEVRTEYHPSGDLTLAVQNLGGARRRLVVTDRATGASRTESLASRRRWSERFPAGRRGGWYDLIVSVDEDPGFALGLAGHVETGKESVSDPALGGDPELELGDAD